LNRLRQAVDEYNHERWRVVSGKLGNGFSDVACKDKFNELDGLATGHYDVTIDESSGPFAVGA
jgi:hypothetical protein